MNLAKIILLSILINLCNKIVAQNGCIDSISFSKYPAQYFSLLQDDERLNSPQRDNLDNIYVNGIKEQGLFNYWGIFKFNSNNQIVWYKNYRILPGQSEVVATPLTNIDEKANLYFNGWVRQTTTDHWQQITKLDSSGNFKWSKLYKRVDIPATTTAGHIITGNSNEELYVNSTPVNNNNWIYALDANGNAKWSKLYGNTSLPMFHNLGGEIVSENANILVLITRFFYNNDDQFNPSAIHGINAIKINKADGKIITQKAFMFYNDGAYLNPNRCKIDKINYSIKTSQFILMFKSEIFSPAYFDHIYAILDSNLNNIKYVFYKSSSTIDFANGRPHIDNDNNIIFTGEILNNSGTEYFCYSTINSNLDIGISRKINLSNLGFPHRNFYGDASFKKNGILNFQLGVYAVFGFPSNINNEMFLFDNSSFYQTTSPCQGKDTSFFYQAPIFIRDLAGITFREVGDLPIQSFDKYLSFPPTDLNLSKQELCKDISICDTIKLFGTPYHCLSNPLDSFKIIRNPLCRRKTNWQVDTTAIKIISQTDTTLHVKYLQAYRGSVKVGFGGCSLTDSMAIEVYAPKTAVSLGKDTMLCPGKTITLYAGAGFTNYQWQDGSTADSLVIAQTGNYIITATDSCGNVFKDTITVTPLDVALNVDYPQGLCLNDTAVFNLPAALYNFTWQPNTASLLTNNLWKLYPTATTLYSISAEREPGCILSDTVLITIKNCPDYIYFPNAFTPNKDGLNDVYKPTVSGRIIVYEFSIYNRYGQPVFKSTTPNQGWNGNFNNSQKPLPGGYVWHCRYQFINQPVVQKKGMFILIR